MSAGETSVPAEDAPTTDDAPTTEDAPTKRKPRRWRSVVAILLVVLAAVLAPLTVAAVWVHERILTTDGYVETVTPLVDEPVVTDALATRIVDRVFSSLDLEQRITEALPGPVAVLGPALSGSLETFAQGQTENVLESDQFEQLWVRANTAAHEQVVAMFSGEGDTVTRKDNAIVLDLGAVGDKARERLVDRGVGVLDKVSVPKGAVEVTLFESDLVSQLQTLFGVLDDLATILPILLALTVVGAIAVAPHRRRIIIGLGLGIAATTALLSVGIDVGERITLDEAHSASLNPDATKAVYDILVSALRDWSWYVIAISLFVAVVALISNPRWIGRLAEMVRGSSPEVPAVAVRAREHRPALLAGIVGLALLTLVVWPEPTVRVLALVVLVAAFLIAVVVALSRMKARDSVAEEAAAAPEGVDQVG